MSKTISLSEKISKPAPKFRVEIHFDDEEQLSRAISQLRDFEGNWTFINDLIEIFEKER